MASLVGCRDVFLLHCTAGIKKSKGNRIFEGGHGSFVKSSSAVPKGRSFTGEVLLLLSDINSHAFRRRASIAKCSSNGTSSSSVGETADRIIESLPDRHIGGGHVTSENGGTQEGIVLPQTKSELEKEKYKWPEAWYPAAVVSDLDKKIPKAVTILGRPLVIWWDRSSFQWQVFLDQCPHRLAPLSEGRIHESGQLQCSYHGWTFGGDGKCGMIPQATNDHAKASPRACAKVIPSREHQGMLFVWPDLAEGAAERAAHVEPPTVPELSDPTFTFDLVSRDMSYGADSLIENLMDPAHVPFAHHSIMGRRERAGPLDFKVDEIYVDGFRGHGPNGMAKFAAPSLFTLRMTLPPQAGKDKKKSDDLGVERKMTLTFYCVPTTPGHSKLFFAFPSNFMPKVVSFVPTWLKHLGQLTILDSDMYFLHVMERRLEAEGGPGNWSRVCYVPTASDSYVSAYRRWQSTYGGKGFDWGAAVDPKLPPSPPKEVILDRYKSHVAQCKVCSGAKRNFDVLQYALAALSFTIVAGLALAAVTQRNPLPMVVAVPLVLLAGGFAVAAERLGKWLYKAYHFQDYCHALVD